MTNNCNSVNHTHLIFRPVKAATEAWIALEDESDEEEIDGEEEETDVETDGEAVEEVFELFIQQINVCQCSPSTYILENYCFEVDLRTPQLVCILCKLKTKPNLGRSAS